MVKTGPVLAGSGALPRFSRWTADPRRPAADRPGGEVMCERERNSFGPIKAWLMAGALALTQFACGGGGVTSPLPLASSPPAPARLEGRWSGSTASMSLIWRLEQDGASVTGS